MYEEAFPMVKDSFSIVALPFYLGSPSIDFRFQKSRSIPFWKPQKFQRNWIVDNLPLALPFLKRSSSSLLPDK